MTNESFSNKLSELFDLYKSGALTKEEFEVLKSKIINQGVVQPIKEEGQEKEPEKTEKEEIDTPQPEVLKKNPIYEPNKVQKVDYIAPQQEKVTSKLSESNLSEDFHETNSKRKLGRIIIGCVLFMGLIMVLIIIFKSHNGNSKLTILNSTDKKVNVKLQTDSVNKSNTKSSLYNTNSPSDSNMNKKNPIPETMEEPISVLDVDGNNYKSVKIGKQIWMAENLKTTKYNDGTTIPSVTDKTAGTFLNKPAYSWYKNDSIINKNIYGALYNWYTVNTNKLCPKGWHVPTNKEWTILIDYLGGETVVGVKLKEAGTTHWLSPNKEATNDSGFTALPGGDRDEYGTFGSIGSFGFWWSSTETSATNAEGRYAYYSYSNLGRNSVDKRSGFSVRCLRDL